MKRRRLLAAGFAAAAGAHLPSARPQRRLWRIGYHSAGSAQSNAGWLDAFRQGMKELVWSEARDYVIDARYADGRSEVLQQLATELVATEPDVLLTVADLTVRMLGQLTKRIPIVFAIGVDPVGQGFAASLKRPGGNATGLTTLSPDLVAKRLQLLKEAFPAVSHVVVLFQGNDSGSLLQVKEYEEAAVRLRIRITPIDLRHAADIEPAFARGSKLGADAYAIATGFMINVQAKAIAEGLIRSKAPSVASSVVLTEAGTLMTYSASIPQNFRRAATYVDKILKGAKPGDLAIEQPTKFDLVINTRTAKALGLQIPQSVLLRADRVIE